MPDGASEKVLAPFPVLSFFGARTNGYVSVMKALWCDDPSAYENEFYTLSECRLGPKPGQTPHPLLVLCDEGRPALRRIAELGQGRNAAMKTPEQMMTLLAELDGLFEENDHTRGELEITVMPGANLTPDDLAPIHPANLGAAPDRLDDARSLAEP